MSGGCKALVLREIGRGHVWGQFLYELLRNGVVIAKVCAAPEDAQRMAAALENA